MSLKKKSLIIYLVKGYICSTNEFKSNVNAFLIEMGMINRNEYRSWRLRFGDFCICANSPNGEKLSQASTEENSH